MAKSHAQTYNLLDLKGAVEFIGSHYVSGWESNDIKAHALPDLDALKRFLAKLKQQCADRSTDYRKYVTVTGKSKRVIIRSGNHIISLAEQFHDYRRALAKYDFSERIPKQFKNDYEAYKRQNEALQILRRAIKTGICNAVFVNAQSGEERNISHAIADKSDLRFDISSGTVKYYGDTGYLSITRAELQEAITKRFDAPPAILHNAPKIHEQAHNSNAEWWTEKQVSDYLGISLSTLRRWRKEGNDQLPFTKIRRSVRYAKLDVENYANSNKRKSTSDF